MSSSYEALSGVAASALLLAVVDRIPAVGPARLLETTCDSARVGLRRLRGEAVLRLPGGKVDSAHDGDRPEIPRLVENTFNPCPDTCRALPQIPAIAIPIACAVPVQVQVSSNLFRAFGLATMFEGICRDDALERALHEVHVPVAVVRLEEQHRV